MNAISKLINFFKPTKGGTNYIFGMNPESEHYRLRRAEEKISYLENRINKSNCCKSNSCGCIEP